MIFPGLPDSFLGPRHGLQQQNSAYGRTHFRDYTEATSRPAPTSSIFRSSPS
jgi:hypothetical protein